MPHHLFAYWSIFSLLLVNFFHTSVVVESQVTPAQDRANTAFFLALRNDLKLLRENVWKKPNDHYCTWDGVRCEASSTGTVVMLALMGTIPEDKDVTLNIPDPSKSYYDGVDWDTVYVTDIYINGSRKVVGSLSREWRKFKSLKRVDFRNTQIAGTIPSEFDVLKNLEYVNFDGCTNLCGTLPNLALPKLEELHFAGINFRGTLPTSWGGMVKIKVLDLSSSTPCGCIPSTYYSNAVLMNYFGNFAVGSVTCRDTNQCTYCDGVCGTPSGCKQCNVVRCRTCSNNNVCQTCGGGLLPSGNTCPLCAVQGCSTCYSSTQCTVCGGGLKPSTDRRQCLTCNVDGCLSCSETNKCSACNPGYTLSNGRCFRCTVANCARCDNADNVCTACKTDISYTLTAGTCIPCNVANCLTCSSAGKCSQCGNGNIPAADGSCPKCSIVNCQYCAEEEKCSACKTGYTLIKEQNRCAMCSVNNCATCGALSQCLECNPGFVLNGLECIECRVTGCERCDLPNKCAQCPAGQQLNVNADACVDCNVDNCITCSSNNVCTQCAYPYTMSGGVCVLCDIINCNLCEVPNVCKQCVEPLKPSGDRTNCLRCDLADCDACSDDNSCAACAVDNCRNCNATNQCGTCRNGFGENENKCIRCQDEHCQTCTGADGGECLVYLPGYEVEEVVVNKEIPFWVWIIVAIGAFLVFLLICFLIAYCCCGCCHRKKKYNIVYLEDMDDHPLAEKARRLQGDKYRARSTHGSSAATSSNSRGDDGSGSTGSPVTQSTNGYRQAPVHDDDSDDSDDEDNNLIDEGEEPQPFEVDNSPRLSGSSFNNRESYADYANQNNNGYPQQQQQVFPDESPNAIYNNQDVYQDAYNQGGYNQGGYNQGGYNQGGGYY